MAQRKLNTIDRQADRNASLLFWGQQLLYILGGAGVLALIIFGVMALFPRTAYIATACNGYKYVGDYVRFEKNGGGDNKEEALKSGIGKLLSGQMMPFFEGEEVVVEAREDDRCKIKRKEPREEGKKEGSFWVPKERLTDKEPG